MNKTLDDYLSSKLINYIGDVYGNDGFEVAGLIILELEVYPDHLAKFDEQGWILQHPLWCRIKGLFNCSMNIEVAPHINKTPDLYEDAPCEYIVRYDDLRNLTFTRLDRT